MDNQLIKIEFSPEQVKLIKQQIAPRATDSELQLFLYQCQRTGLDPLTRQIYCIHREVWDPITRVKSPKMTIQTSIDGFRVIAERSGSYAGQSEPIFVEDESGHLKAVKVSIFRFSPTGMRYEAAVGVAFWNEYVQTDKDGNPIAMWKKMPRTMLAKVAEALGLRKAFPQDLSGLYTGDEMAQDKAEDVQEVLAQAPSDAENLELWKGEIDRCSNRGDLVILYNKNRALIDGWPELKKVFASRRDELTTTSAHASNTPAQY